MECLLFKHFTFSREQWVQLWMPFATVNKKQKIRQQSNRSVETNMAESSLFVITKCSGLGRIITILPLNFQHLVSGSFFLASPPACLSLSFRVFVCVKCVHVWMYMHTSWTSHGAVLKRGQLMGNQRKQRPWHCSARWRLTLLSHTDKRMNVVKLRHVISSPLVTGTRAIIVTQSEPRGVAQDDQITARRARGDEETPGLLKDERQLWQIHREVHGAFRRHNIHSGGHVGGLVVLGNNGCEQLIAFLNVYGRVYQLHWVARKSNMAAAEKNSENVLKICKLTQSKGLRRRRC